MRHPDALVVSSASGRSHSAGHLRIIVLMTYVFDFDQQSLGDREFSVEVYRSIQEGLKALRDEVEAWNSKGPPPMSVRVNTWSGLSRSALESLHGESLGFGSPGCLWGACASFGREWNSF